MGDYAGSLSDARSEPSLSASDSTDSRGFRRKTTSGEGNQVFKLLSSSTYKFYLLYNSNHK